MSTRKNVLVTLGLTMSASLLAAALAVLFFTFHYGRLQFDLLNAVCGEVVEQDPEARRIVAAALKEYTGGNADGTAVEDILWSLGYRVSDFSVPTYRQSLWCIGAGFLAGSLLFACTWAYRNRREALRVQALTAYLEQACTGAAPILSASVEASSRETSSGEASSGEASSGEASSVKASSREASSVKASSREASSVETSSREASSGEPATGEDDFSRLEDEIYK